MGSKSKKPRKRTAKRDPIDSEGEEDSIDEMPAVSLSDVDDESDKSESMLEENVPQTQQKAIEHMKQLQRLEEKDPEFYQFLKDYDKELLEFDDVDFNEDAKTELDEPEDSEPHVTAEKVQKSSEKVITTTMVNTWCNAVREKSSLRAVRTLMRAFRTACHYGDDTEDEPSIKFRIMSSSVFNKIMLFVLSEMDEVLRGLLKMPSSGGKKETIMNLANTKGWKTYGHIVKSYLANSLHVLNQMTDSQMISFTLRRLRYSAVFLAAFPSLLRKYIQVALHFWGTGGGALPVVSFLFLRDICIRLGSDCLDTCLKGIYKAYVMNCQHVNASRLQHIQFLGNCVIELYGVDTSSAYQQAFSFIRQMGMILRDALTIKTKEAFRKVYEWKYMNCLELWTGVICAYSSETDIKPLAYPLTQIISGVARLVPTARYFPLRLRCARMLNRIAAATGSFVPVSLPLLDMLVMKELNRPPSGGVGKAIDLRTTLKVSKPALKTRAFQEACVFSVVEELAEHLAQWSYSVAFFELSFIPLVRLRSFCKATKVERFRREIKQLIRQVEANSEFTNARRMNITFSPNDPAIASFLKAEKESGASPLSQHIAILRARARERNDSMVESSILVGADSSVFGSKVKEIDEEDDTENPKVGAAAFSSSWLPGNDKATIKKSKSSKRQHQKQLEVGPDEDVVEDLVLSSDEDEPVNDYSLSTDEGHEVENSPLKQNSKKRKHFPPKQNSKKQKPPAALPKKKRGRPHMKKPKKIVN
ncbi:nucleolar complex-associated protein 2 isoform X2 [Magnolia sinica]|uniref:nucleolar complex-associated protein 2 isoform X2 n=1 Tax=Magnolia sinica TaxID=86752 RepID=UPI002658B1CC|nr:nucleolar complex-associated protein 2 isoform X2 [Magnolia sinica]